MRRGMPAAIAQPLVTEGMAGTAELLRAARGRHAGAAARGRLAGRHDRARPGGARARRGARRVRAGDGRRGGVLMDARQEIADFLSRADLRLHDLIIFAGSSSRSCFSLGVRVPYSRSLERGAGLPARRHEPVPADLPAPARCSSARSTSARSSRSSCCRSAGGIIVGLIARREPRTDGAARRAGARRRSCVADQVDKALVRGEIGRGERDRRSSPGVELVNTRNTGVAFGLFSGGGAARR